MKWINNILTLLFINLLSQHATAQVYSYSYNHKEEKLHSSYQSLSFHIGTNYYELIAGTATSGGGCGQMFTEQLSYGFVMRHKNTVILHDVRGSYNMKVELSDTSLKVIKGFEAFKNINFTWSGKYNQKQFVDSLDVKHDDDNLNRKTTLDSILFQSGTIGYDNQHKDYQFSTGFYTIAYNNAEPRSDSTDKHLVFTHERYEYKLGEMLLTKGTWKRNGDYILMKDNTLNSYFILRLVGNNSFITEVFPFANMDLAFTLGK